MSALLKHVQIFKSGKQTKTFDCRACDLSQNVVSFYGVILKRHDSRRAITFHHVGNSYIEIDHNKRECIVIPENPDVQILITW